ncbi:MAG: hypothetical protein V4655_09990 [Bdellovibrionota bacterium]
MISYLGVTIDELVTSFEDSLVYSDDRIGRIYEGPYKELYVPDVKDIPPFPMHGTSEQIQFWKDTKDDYWPEDREVAEDVFVDDEGRIHSLSEALGFAAESLVGFLTDYIVTDEIDDEWMNLSIARGALLGVRVALPAFTGITDITSVYKIRIDRDLKTGKPTNIRVEALDHNIPHLDYIKSEPTHYEGIFSDETKFEEYLTVASIPLDEHPVLREILTDVSFRLGDERCGIVLDIRKFRGEILRLAARHRMHVVPNETSH